MKSRKGQPKFLPDCHLQLMNSASLGTRIISSASPCQSRSSPGPAEGEVKLIRDAIAKLGLL
ncbi:MAG: hypothetical protein AABZ66_03685, partial [Candidatus Binatota bacterium]